MNRDEFLTRVRTAAAQGRGHRVAANHDLPSDTGYCGAGDDPLTRFAAEVVTAGGHCEIVESPADAGQALELLLERYAPRSALCWLHPLLDRVGVATRLNARQVALVDHALLSTLEPGAQRAKVLAADIGITSATWAIAETGSLLMAAEPGRERMASLLPRVHVAIVSREQIVPDLFDAFAALDGREPARALPSNVVLITGPSKTGDLELKLTTGIHGPAAWHVIVSRRAN